MGWFGFGEGRDIAPKKGYQHNRASSFFPAGSHASRFFQIGEGSHAESYTDWVDDNITTAQFLYSGEFMDQGAIDAAVAELEPQFDEHYGDMQRDYDNMKSVYDGSKRLTGALQVENQNLRKQYNDLYLTIQNLQRRGSPLGKFLQNVGSNMGGVTQVQKMLSPASYATPGMAQQTMSGMPGGSNAIGNVWQNVLQNQAQQGRTP